MNKPDWKDAPKWARWLAQNMSGTWYWYEEKPEWVDGYWNAEEGELCRPAYPLYIDGTENSLEERPK